ncbi:predicted protein [Thalassiosira pseudonana CCMP1335]|uniref:Uncharacterized protein n=1 Tax=Thalassiosira pseudonana TaxID=35128 RepID=B8BR98_THAPS|nr:predicted protein [Thalassiosira pseudonana CCMP1335]EED96498.1 predicted protein [Thalassiosira pseudonana CCMP1335]
MVTVVEYLSAAIKDKPLDASDVSDLQSAKAELKRLRRVACRVCDILNKTSLVSASDDGGEVSQKRASQQQQKKAHRHALKEDDAYKTYKKVTVAKSDAERELLKSAIAKNLLFKGCTSADLDEFVDVFVQRKFYGGSTVIQQGDVGETFYVVQSGTLDIFINVGEGEEKTETQVGVPYGSGAGFGELALIYGSPRAATIRSSEDCVLWEISRTAFKGLQLQNEQKAHNLKLTELRRVKVGDKLLGDIMSSSQVENMALATQSQSFNKGHVIIREGEKGDVFYVITKGSVDVFKKSAGSEKLATLGVHSFFGEKALLSSDTRQATCIASSDVECLTLSREDFVRMLGNFEDLLSGRTSIPASPSKSTQSSKTETTTLAFNDLEIRGVLGEGAFGKVNLVKSRTDGKLYALKAQGKAFVVENGQQEHLLMEYKIMRELNHVFIVKCHQAFQDSRFVYFLMSLLCGGELMDLLDSQRQFPENWTRFYGASVLSAFSCIHEKKIAYRDLKPENLVLDADGYCYVIDFGLAKKCDEGKTWTFCGTPDYLAPEIIRGKGHDWGVDYWGLGVLFYELTHGYPPFYADDPTNTARKIIRGTFPIPSKFSKSLGDIITKLLTEQSKRLGRTQGGITHIMEHPWFSGFDWEALLSRSMEVPSKPKLGDLEKLGRSDNTRVRVAESNWNPVFE